jgi:hypothetical protein
MWDNIRTPQKREKPDLILLDRASGMHRNGKSLFNSDSLQSFKNQTCNLDRPFGLKMRIVFLTIRIGFE